MPIRDRGTWLRRRIYGRFFELLGERGLRAFYSDRFAGLGVIFMFHRIVEREDATLYPGYAVCVEALDAWLRFVRDAGWEIVSIDQVAQALRGEPRDRRFACFTFDDGYRDNHTLALPVFRKHQAPMCVYVTTGMVDRTLFYWWGALERLVLTRDEIEVDLPNDPLGARRVRTATLKEKLDAYRIIDGWCHANQELTEDVLRRLFKRYGVDDRALLDQHGLTDAEIRTFAQDPLVTIGSHGVSHQPLSRLSDQAVAEEFAVSRQRLEGIAGAAVRHLAYPYGSRGACGRREFDLAAASGYVTGVTTRRGNLFAEHGDHLLALPRREASPSISAAREALHGVSSIMRRDPVMVIE